MRGTSSVPHISIIPGWIRNRTLRGKTTSEENAVPSGTLWAMHHSSPDGLPGGSNKPSTVSEWLVARRYEPLV